MVDGHWRRNGPRLVVGLVVVALGILFTLDKLGYVEAGSLWEYWPVLLIAAGLGRLLLPRGCHGRGFGVVLIVIGTLFLLENLGRLPYRVWDFWPVLLLLLGISMIWRAMGRPGGRGSSRWREVGFASGLQEGATPPAPAGMATGTAAAVPPVEAGDADASATVDCFALLGGSRRRSVSQDFRGGSLFAFMGGCELDLRQASIRGQATIDAFAMWGGIEIKVPQDWTVALHGTPILGSFDDKTVRMGGDGSKVLVVTGAAVMGGVEIKN